MPVRRAVRQSVYGRRMDDSENLSLEVEFIPLVHWNLYHDSSICHKRGEGGTLHSDSESNEFFCPSGKTLGNTGSSLASIGARLDGTATCLSVRCIRGGSPNSVDIFKRMTSCFIRRSVTMNLSEWLAVPTIGNGHHSRSARIRNDASCSGAMASAALLSRCTRAPSETCPSPRRAYSH